MKEEVEMEEDSKAKHSGAQSLLKSNLNFYLPFHGKRATDFERMGIKVQIF
jgi:hypothetical protein